MHKFNNLIKMLLSHWLKYPAGVCGCETPSGQPQALLKPPHARFCHHHIQPLIEFINRNLSQLLR